VPLRIMPKNKSSKKKSSPAKRVKKTDSKQSVARVYVRGLQADTTTDALKTYAGKEATWVRWLKHQNGKFTGCAFVDFSSQKAAKNFVKKNGEEFEGRELLIKAAETSKEYGGTPQIKTFDIAVSGFPEDDEDKLKEFAGAGVKRVHFMKNRDDDFNGLAFASFGSAKDADNFMKKSGKEFEGSEITLRFGSRNTPSAYVSGFPEGTSEKDVKNFVGNKKAVDAVRFAGKDDAYCFVDFNSIAACNKFLKKNGSDLKGETVTISLSRGQNMAENRKLFIGQLPDKYPVEELRDYLKQSGNVKWLKCLWKKNIAFVTFSTPEEAQACQKNHKEEFNGNKLMIVPAKQIQRKQ